jgi:prolyl-tRNA synthetase
MRTVEMVELSADANSIEELEGTFSSRFEMYSKKSDLNLVKAVDLAHRSIWILPHNEGPLSLFACHSCNHRATLAGAWTGPEEIQVAMEELREIHTPGAHTMQALADSAGVRLDQTMKVVMLATEDNLLIFALIRGDRDVNESKISAFLGGKVLRPATETEIKLAGADPGFASPYGLEVREQVEKGPGIVVLADPTIQHGKNFVIGANRPDYHLRGANPERDFQVTEYVDINRMIEGDPCPECDGKLVIERGIKTAEWWPILDAFTFTDADGKSRQGVAGRGRILLEPTLAAVLCEHSQDRQLKWPAWMAPFNVHLISIGADDEARILEANLQNQGYRVLLDDRQISAGIKFGDADLLGSPIRITVSERSLQAGGVELAVLDQTEVEIVPLNQVILTIDGLRNIFMSS